MTVAIVIAIAVAVTALDLMIVVGIIHWGWGPLSREFPATEPGDDAVWRRYQSFRLGLLSLGYCIHVAADERYLHLVPIKPLRAFGAAAASIPWQSIRILTHTPGDRWITVRIGTRTMKGPAWCLELASPDERIGTRLLRV